MLLVRQCFGRMQRRRGRAALNFAQGCTAKKLRAKVARWTVKWLEEAVGGARKGRSRGCRIARPVLNEPEAGWEVSLAAGNNGSAAISACAELRAPWQWRAAISLASPGTWLLAPHWPAVRDSEAPKHGSRPQAKPAKLDA